MRRNGQRQAVPPPYRRQLEGQHPPTMRAAPPTGSASLGQMSYTSLKCRILMVRLPSGAGLPIFRRCSGEWRRVAVAAAAAGSAARGRWWLRVATRSTRYVGQTVTPRPLASCRLPQALLVCPSASFPLIDCPDRFSEAAWHCEDARNNARLHLRATCAHGSRSALNRASELLQVVHKLNNYRHRCNVNLALGVCTCSPQTRRLQPGAASPRIQ